MTGRQRCDEILRLIDEALAEQERYGMGRLAPIRLTAGRAGEPVLGPLPAAAHAQP